jgi:hypothetical protein
MISRYKQIALEQAGVGAVLAADVLDGQGSVLVAKGTELTGPVLRALERRGIDRLRVRDENVPPELLAAERERASLRLARLFRHPGPGQADALLREVLTRYRLEDLA